MAGRLRSPRRPAPPTEDPLGDPAFAAAIAAAYSGPLNTR